MARIIVTTGDEHHHDILSHIRRRAVDGQAADLDPGKPRAEQICSVLNLCFGWPGADSQWSRDAGYTGRVVLSLQAAQEVVDLHDRVKELEGRIVELVRARGPFPTSVTASNGNPPVSALPSP